MPEEPKALVQITRRGAVVWTLLILFIAVWMFVLGILVGRGTAPMQLEADHLQQELAQLKAALMKKEQAEIEAQASGQTDQKTQLGFYEALKETKRQPVHPVPRPGPAAAAKAAPHPAARLPLEVEDKASGAAPVESGEMPSKASKPPPVEPAKTSAGEKTTPRAPVEVKPAVSEKAAVSAPPPPEASKPASDPGPGALTIQVGAFKDGPGAEQMVARLRAKGFPAYQIRGGSAEKGIWYRVRVGAFNDRPAAQSMLKKLAADQIQGVVVATP